MDGLDQRIQQAESTVRALLMRTSRDDSYGTQVELREALEKLRLLRHELEQRDPAGLHS